LENSPKAGKGEVSKCLDSKIIKKVVNQVQNLRILGFNALTKEDLEELTGGLIAAGTPMRWVQVNGCRAVLHGHTWVINGLDVDELPRLHVRLPIGETVARLGFCSEWLKDSAGHGLSSGTHPLCYYI